MIPYLGSEFVKGPARPFRLRRDRTGPARRESSDTTGIARGSGRGGRRAPHYCEGDHHAV
jgi:hypothetical protein